MNMDRSVINDNKLSKLTENLYLFVFMFVAYLNLIYKHVLYNMIYNIYNIFRLVLV